MIRIRIVHVEDFFHPFAGYQLNLLSKYMSAAGWEVIIVTSEMSKMPAHLIVFFGADNIYEKDKWFETEYNVKIIRVPIYMYYSGRSVYKPGLFRLLDSLNPDVLFVHGVGTYLGLRCALRLNKFKYPVVFDNHMVDIASKNRLSRQFNNLFKKLVTPNIIRHKSFVIRAMEDDYVWKYHGIPLTQAPFGGFGSDIVNFHPDDDVKISVRRELSIPTDNFVFIYAGKMDESKGGKLLANAIVDKFECKKSVSFLIIGNLSGDYGAAINNILKTSKNQICLLPTQQYINLSKYFQCADAALFPKKCSLTYFDVQACGLPVILEDNAINIERITHNNGLLYRSGEITDFRNRMSQLLNMDDNSFAEMSRRSEQFIRDNYNYKSVTARYIEIIEEAVYQFKNTK